MMATAFAIGMAVVLPTTQAGARIDIDVNVGIGGCDFGPGFGPDFSRLEPEEPGISCDKARRNVRENGSRNIRTLDYSASSHRFTGWIGPQKYAIEINEDGAITHIRRI